MSQQKLEWMLRKWPNRKFILVGDWYQLPPIDGEPIDIKQYNQIELIKQFRAVDPNIMKFIEAIKYGNNDIVRHIIREKTITEEQKEAFPIIINLSYKNVTKDKNR
jgi:hypothetical protein